MKNPETKVDRNAATMKEELKDMNNRNGMDKRQYYDLKKRSEIREGAQKLRKQYLRYREAEIIYSMSHKKLLELAGKAGAIVYI